MSVLKAGQDTATILAAVVAAQRRFTLEPHSSAPLEAALNLLGEISQSSLGILDELLPAANGAESSLQPLATFGGSAATTLHQLTASQSRNGRARDTWQLSLDEARQRGALIQVAIPAGRLQLPELKQQRQLVYIPLNGQRGEPVGSVQLLGGEAPLNAATLSSMQPVCDALGAMLAARQASRHASAPALESHLKIFADDVFDAVFLHDDESRVVDLNERACESLGYTRAELVGKTPAAFDRVCTAERIAGYVMQLRQGKPVIFESRHIRKDGSDFPVEIRCRPASIGGKFYILALARDITDLKLTEQKLRESEERLELALQASRMGVWEWNIRTNRVFWSAECYGIYGAPTFDGNAETLSNMIHPDDTIQLGEIVYKTLECGTTNHWEFRLIPSDGRVRWIANSAIVRRDSDGKPVTLLGTARDVTEQRLAEEALRQSTLLLENVVENIPLAVFVKDPHDNFNIRLWNKAAETIFGLKREEIIGKRALDYWPQAEAEYYEAMDKQAIREGMLQEVFETSSGRLGGTSKILHTRKLPLFDSDGKPTLLLAICDDITERRRAEEALRQVQQRLDISLTGADVGLWDWDLLTDEVIFSEQWKRQLGYSDDEISNTEQEWESRVHPDDLPQALETIRRAVERQSAEYRAEFRMRHRDGSWRWILSRGSVICDANDKPIRMLGVHLDITDRKRSEEELQASEQRYRSFVDHATDALFLQDHEARVVDVNEQACISLGYSRDELIGMLPFDFDPLITQAAMDSMSVQLNSGETISLDSRHQRKDGTTFPVEVRLRPFWMNNQRYHISLVRDITERKRAEESLRASEERLRTLLENLDKVAVQACGTDGKITFWNRASERLYGYSAAEAIGHDLTELIHPESTREQERRLIAESLRAGKISAVEEIETINRDGEKLIVFASRVVHSPPEKQPEFFRFDVDITDRKRAEEELSLRQAELLHASRLSTVGQMVAEISHEVAQPLNAIGNFAAASERILETGIQDQFSSLFEYVRAILEQNQRCMTILGRLRDFSRRAPASRGDCDLNQLLHESVKLLSWELRRHRIKVVFQLTDNLPPVWGDRVQLQQVMVNLLTNARDALQDQRDDRRRIVLRSHADEAAVEFEVEDSGSGLAGDASVHLFDPFFTTKPHGMGIGLSICQSIAKEHGGRIDAFSPPQGGTIFRLRLPLQRK